MSRIENSEARLRAIIDAVADAILIVDSDGIVQFANVAAAALFGRPLDQILTKPFGFPVFAGATTELDIVRGDGQAPVIAELRVVATLWNDEPAFLATLHDMTERVRAEQRERELLRAQMARSQAEATERRTRFLLDAAHAVSTAFDDVSGLARLADHCVPFLADWCIIDLIAPDGKVERAAVAHANPEHGDLAAELRTHADVPCATILERIGPLREAVVPLTMRGRTIGAFTLVRSQPDRDQTRIDVPLAEELAHHTAIAVDNARLFNQANRASLAKSNFLAVISHELRTPLNAILGYADLLAAGVPREIPPEARQHVSRLRASARHLLHLIDEILTFTRMEANREAGDVTEVMLYDVVKKVAAVIEPVAADHQLEFNVRLPERDYPLRTDADKVGQILRNLLSNAVKFTPAGSVVLEATPVGDWTHFHVSDSGVGIPASQLEQIFEPFWQADQDRTRQADGTGLGLTVARRLAAMLGGRLSVRSAPGKGSTFTLQLPNRSRAHA